MFKCHAVDSLLLHDRYRRQETNHFMRYITDHNSERAGRGHTQAMEQPLQQEQFFLFTKLPLEIRRMVFEKLFDAYLIHLINNDQLRMGMIYRSQKLGRPDRQIYGRICCHKPPFDDHGIHDRVPLESYLNRSLDLIPRVYDLNQLREVDLGEVRDGLLSLSLTCLSLYVLHLLLG